MNSRQAILIGIRPATLLLGISPVLFGSALGYQYLVETLGKSPTLANLIGFIGAIAVVLLLQSGANLVNDVKDAESGVDSESRVGPLRVVQSGLLSADIAKKAYRYLFASGILIGCLLSIYGGIELAVLALACAAIAYLYTGGPKPLSHLGLGEVVALLFFGPVAVLGSAYLQSFRWQFNDLLWASGPGFLAAAVMAINNLRDRRGDKLNGKKTLAVVLGDKFGERLPWGLILASIVVFVFYCLLHGLFMEGLTITLLMLLVLKNKIRPLIFPRAELLNKALKATSLFVVAYCIAYTLVVFL